MKGGEQRMKLDKVYLTGVALLVAGFLFSIDEYTPLNAFFIGLGFILILISYGK